MFQAQDQPKCGKDFFSPYLLKKGIAELKYVSRGNGRKVPCIHSTHLHLEDFPLCHHLSEMILDMTKTFLHWSHCGICCFDSQNKSLNSLFC